MRVSIYEAVGGKNGMISLAHAWHKRCLTDPIVSHAFSHGFHPNHSERLAAYWSEALGGPTEYTDSIGDESFVVKMHSGNGEHTEMDERAHACFEMALDDLNLSDDLVLRKSLSDYFRWAIRAMSAYPLTAGDVPAGLTLPKWTWDGPAKT